MATSSTRIVFNLPIRIRNPLVQKNARKKAAVPQSLIRAAPAGPPTNIPNTVLMR